MIAGLNLFQLLAIAFLVVLLLLTLVAGMRRWLTSKEVVICALVWISAAVAIGIPKLTGTIAHFLGIGRGADLVLYCAVVVMLVGFVMVYVRLRRLRRDMTLLTRHLAIRDAMIRPMSSSDSTPDAPVAPPRADTPR